MPVFGPAADLVAWRVPNGETFVVEQKDPKPLTPRPASLDKTNAGDGRAGQLAVLKQGPPIDGSVRLWDRAAGAGKGKRDGLQGLGSPHRILEFDGVLCWGYRLAGNGQWCPTQPRRFRKLFGMPMNYFTDPRWEEGLRGLNMVFSKKPPLGLAQRGLVQRKYLDYFLQKLLS